MTKFLQILIFICLLVILVSCNGSEKKVPVWENLKITDIAPIQGPTEPPQQLLKTINFNIYVIDLPAEKFSVIENAWQLLYEKPIRLNARDAFKKNSFRVGFGRGQMWDEIGNSLRKAGARTVDTVSLLLFADQPEDLIIADLRNAKTIYVTTKDGMEASTVGPGKVVMRLTAKKIPGARGVSNISVVPVVRPPLRSLIPQLQARSDAQKFEFPSLGFNVNMSPTDFIFLAPEKYIDNDMTLGGLFFSAAGRKQIVRSYLIVCTSIID